MYGSLGQVTLVGPFDLTCCKVIFFDCFSWIPTPYPHSVMTKLEDLIMPLDLLNQDQKP